MAIRLNAGIDHKAFVKDVEKGMRMANQALNKKANTLKLKLDDKGFRQPLGRITGDLNMFDSALAASNARVIAFGASTAVIGGISKAFKELAKTTIEVGKAFKDINRILQMSNKGFEQFGNQLFDIAKKNATAFEDVTKGALEFARQGLKTEETLRRTADAMTLVRLTGINADKAVSSLTATVNAFDSAMVTTTSSLNKFVAVETKFAVGARDLVEAIGRVGSSAKDAKVGFDELNAMVTAVQQTTGRGGAVIGNAMKTIFTRLQRQSTLTALESYNVAVRDIEGNTLPAMKILDNFAKTYAGLADASQAYLREQVAGVFQANILSAILRDLNKQQSTFSSALTVSKNATNEAAQATQLLNQSLSALASQTATEFKRLQENIGKQTFEPIARGILDPLKSALEGLNNLIDGEGAGSEVANAILKGIKNVIGGPGLIAVLGIVGKVIFNTVSYMAKALPSLVGLTTETQKRATLEKYISDSLREDSSLAKQVAAAEGNAAVQAGIFLGKAEKAAAALDKQEASIANIARMMMMANPAAFGMITGDTKGKGARGASGFIPGMAGEVNDIRRGVGGVSPSSKPVAIPNFAFGGGVRGTMIANTGEYIVPNYSNGGSAIFNPNMVAQYGMPKGAKPIRGAQGYVPNFAGDVNKALTKLDTLTPGSSAYNTYTQGLAKSGILAPSTLNQGPAAIRANIARKAATEKKRMGNTYTSRNIAMLFPPGTAGAQPYYQHNFKNLLGKGPTSVRFPAYTYAKKPKGGADDILPIKQNIEDAIYEETVKYANSVRPPAGSVTKAGVIANLESAQGGKGAVSAAAGAAFEVGVQTALGIQAAAPERGMKNLDVPLANASLKGGGELRQLFNQPAPMMSSIRGADFKISPSADNVKSMAGKIVDLDKRFVSWMAQRGAHGYVPNFAALGDAVEREVAAGVPLTSIRVNRSSRLSSPNNPAGLAVTNTRDEPRGLKDVIGASRGYVPNFVDFSKVTATDSLYGGRYQKLLEREQQKLVAAYQKQIKDMNFQDMTEKELEMAQKQLIATIKAQLTGKKLTKAAENRLRGEIQKETAELAASRPGGGGAAGGMGGNRSMYAGMALSFAAPMAAGAIEQAGGPREASSALTGVGTGAALGMMIPGPWGTLIGGALGGIIGFGVEAAKVGKSLSELSSELQEFERTTQENKTAGEGYIQAQKDFLNATTDAEAENATQRMAKYMNDVAGTGLDEEFEKAGTDVDAMTQSLKRYTDSLEGERIARMTAVKAASAKRAQGITVEERFGADAARSFKPGQRLRTKLDQDPINQFDFDAVPKILRGQDIDPKSVKEFFTLMGPLLSQMGELTEAEQKAITEAARLADVMDGAFQFNDTDKARAKLVEIFKGKGVMGLDDEAMETLFNDNLLLYFQFFKDLYPDFQKAKVDAAKVRAQQNKDAKELRDSLINITTGVREAAKIAEGAAINNFKEAFNKLNSAFVSVGSQIGELTGDFVGVARLRASTNNRRNVLKNVQTRSGFGREGASKLLGGFKGAVIPDENSIQLLRSVTEQMLTDPGAALEALQGGMAKGTFRSQDPEKFAKFENTARTLQQAYDKQEKNIEIEQLVTRVQNQIAIKKAETVELEKRLTHEQAMNEKARSTNLAKEELRSKLTLGRLDIRQRDPARTRGFTGQEALLSDQKLAQTRLNEEKRMMDERVRQEVANLNAQFSMQEALIKSNYEIVGAEKELEAALTALTKEMIGSTFTEKDFAAAQQNFIKNDRLVQQTTAETQGMGPFGIPRRVAAMSDAAKRFGTIEEFRNRQAEQRMNIGFGAGDPNFKGGDASTNVELTRARDLLKARIQASKDLNEQEKENLQTLLEENSVLDRQIEKRKTSFKAGFQDGFDAIYRDTDQIYNRLGKELPTAFRDGMVNALEQSLDKAETFGDAMRGVAIDFLKTIRRASLQYSMSNLTSLLGMGVSKGFRESGPGLQNGAFVPGSGTGDRVPAMLEPGEYVMNRKAVGAVGRNNLDAINFGMAPRFSNGGSMMLNESVKSNRMSGFFLASDNPELMEAREKARAEYEKKQAEKAEKKSLKNAFLSTLLSVGISKGIGALAGKFGPKKADMTGGMQPKDLSLSGQVDLDRAIIKAGGQEQFASQQGYASWTDLLQSGDLGGMNLGRRKGGYISRGFTNRDSVPAYMAGGEFVMNNRAVRKYGLGFMGRINGGLIPTMQAGGPVPGGAAAAPLNTQTAANTNNISINVNVGGGGGDGQGASASTGNQNADQQSNQDKATQGKELSERIRAAVIDVIAQEQRLGGSLSKTARQG